VIVYRVKLFDMGLMCLINRAMSVIFI